MKYLGITQKTAEWLLNSSHRNAISQEIKGLIEADKLKECILSIGALRIAAYESTVLCLWNTDYLSASGYEEWGFVSLSKQHGLLAVEEILEEVLERCLLIINLRLQGLLLPDDRFIHRSLGGNAHSCLSGRGEARQYSIGYVEDTIRLATYEARSLVCVGPWGGTDFDDLKRLAQDAGNQMQVLLESANNLLTLSKKRPAIDSSLFKDLREQFLSETTKQSDGIPIQKMPELSSPQQSADVYSTVNWNYDKWLTENSPLTQEQRFIINSDVILKQPIRITGTAGSGKTLTMQLLAMQRLRQAKENKENLRSLYVVHNMEMANTVEQRFLTLGADEFLKSRAEQFLDINTLFGFCQDMLSIPANSVIDKDANNTKIFQRDEVMRFTEEIFLEKREIILEQKDGNNICPILRQFVDKNESFTSLIELICNEIGVTIKGRALIDDRKRYTQSEKPLSRFHALLSIREREIVFDIFEMYRHEVFEVYQVLDSDDVAISLLGTLNTPLWEMQRKIKGYDFVFVDETQLFNENERSLFHFLTKGDSNHLPIALALDLAQDLRGNISSGFGRLGIENISNQNLRSVHRCTKDILKLAFFIIQRTVDLFTAEFPDFTSDTVTLVPDNHPLAEKPRLIVRGESATFAKSIVKEVRLLRSKNIRQIAIIVMVEKYWDEIKHQLSKELNIPLFIQSKRGELIDPQKPIVVLTRPDNVGGQEFDAVICIGLERGLIPRQVAHGGLSAALEQQALREIYLSFTRARYQLILINPRGSDASRVIQDAISEKLINEELI
ncbi:MAG TPA: UvrD-helicase domain-containing protein [Pyrinomonadaceae bacterium]|jgi:hypothetical protein